MCSSVDMILSAEGAAVQWCEPARQWEPLWRGQSQKCTEDDTESCASLSWYICSIPCFMIGAPL